MSERNYPLILIDRSKHETYPYDYIVCLDTVVGFIARAVFLQDEEMLNEFTRAFQNEPIQPPVMKKGKGAISLIIEDFLHDFEMTETNVNRVQTLMKKGLKKYFHTPTYKKVNMNSETTKKVECKSYRFPESNEWYPDENDINRVDDK